MNLCLHREGNEIMNTFTVTAVGIMILVIVLYLISKGKKGTRKIAALVFVLGLLWFSRFVVDHANQELNTVEAVFDSLVHALQTFSLDADYTKYTAEGKDFFVQNGFPVFAGAYGILVSILHVLALILGGALILDILSRSFSMIWLFFKPFCHKFVFSELNEESVTLAEDIVRDKNYESILPPKYKFGRKALIFTDAYRDDESEKNSELFNRAKAIGAICIKKDLLHLSLRKSKSVDYFLIDKNSGANLSALASLLDSEKKQPWPKRRIKEKEEPCVRIFTFLQDDSECSMAATIYRGSKYAGYVMARSIRDYMNASLNLLYDVPLFLPLLPKDGRCKRLTLTILGGGHIAEEVFKAAFWCGQMIDVKLKINVVASNADLFKQRIENKCPELMESCKAGSEILRVFPERNVYNEPYCESLDFIRIDDVHYLSGLGKDILKETDYYVIALGDDGRNIEIANMLKEQLIKEGLQRNRKENPVIALAVYDGELAKSIEVLEPEKDQDAPGCAPYMIPFATRENRFSCKNVFMAEIRESAVESGMLYDNAKAKQSRKDEYTDWANLAKELHVSYKLYGIDSIEKVSLDGNPLEAEKEKEQVSYGRYIYIKEKINTLAEIIGRDEKKETQETIEEKKLAWIEHRRWNAFMRTQGFSCPGKEQYEAYYAQHLKNAEKCSLEEEKESWIGMHKSIELHLHPCMVEGNLEQSTGIELEKKSFSEFNDCLDKQTEDSYKKEKAAREKLKMDKIELAKWLEKSNYKKWDRLQQDHALKEEIHFAKAKIIELQAKHYQDSKNYSEAIKEYKKSREIYKKYQEKNKRAADKIREMQDKIIECQGRNSEIS